jgi:hypothetical protein
MPWKRVWARLRWVDEFTLQSLYLWGMSHQNKFYVFHEHQVTGYEPKIWESVSTVHIQVPCWALGVWPSARFGRNKVERDRFEMAWFTTVWCLASSLQRSASKMLTDKCALESTGLCIKHSFYPTYLETMEE